MPAPSIARRHRFAVSSHAFERFRERVEDEYACRLDDEIMDLLDQKLRFPEGTWPVTDPRAPDLKTTLYGISTKKAGRFYVVVRDDTAITVLEEWMAARNFMGQWEPPPKSAPTRMAHSPFAAALKGVVAAPPTPPAVRLVPAPDLRRVVIDAWERRRTAEQALEAAERELDAAETAFDVAMDALSKG